MAFSAWMSIWNFSMFLCLKVVKTLQILFPDTEDGSLKHGLDVKPYLSSLNTLPLLKETNSIKAAKSLATTVQVH